MVSLSSMFYRAGSVEHSLKYLGIETVWLYHVKMVRDIFFRMMLDPSEAEHTRLAVELY